MSSELSQKLSRLYNSKTLPWIIICVGIALRLIRYLYNPSLWFDEASIAVDLNMRSITDLITPSPYYGQTYPIGFLVLIKLSINLLGNSEWAFRLFPFLFGIASLYFFYKVARHYLKPQAVPVALGLFAILDPLVHYSSELKPYIIDVAIALMLYSATIYVKTRRLNAPRIIFFGIFGAAAIWF